MMQLIALKVFLTALGKGDKSLVYFHKEHHVSIKQTHVIIICINLFIIFIRELGCMSASSGLEPIMDQWVMVFVIVYDRKSYIKAYILVSRDSHLFDLLVILLEFTESK